jgi:hypothetical protein
MKEKELQQLLQNADDQTVERMAELSPMADERAKRRMLHQIQRNCAVSEEWEPAEEDGGEVITARSGWFNVLTAAAACLAIAGTAVGGVYLSQRAPALRPAQDAEVLTSTELPPETAEVQPETANALPFAAYLDGRDLCFEQMQYRTDNYGEPVAEPTTYRIAEDARREAVLKALSEISWEEMEGEPDPSRPLAAILRIGKWQDFGCAGIDPEASLLFDPAEQRVIWEEITYDPDADGNIFHIYPMTQAQYAAIYEAATGKAFDPAEVIADLSEIIGDTAPIEAETDTALDAEISEETVETQEVPWFWSDWGVNSRGDTYASAGQVNMNRTTYDELPDLIRFGWNDETGIKLDDVFARKTELFELFGDDPDAMMSKLSQTEFKSAAATEFGTLYLYDKEGEPTPYSITYYTEPGSEWLSK